MRWFRYYTEAAQDGKVQRLSAVMFRHWVNVLSLANEGKPRGRLPCMSDIAFWLHVSAAKAERIIGELRERGLLDDLDGRLVPHNWDERQPGSDDAAERMRNKRGTSSEHVHARLDKNREEQNRTEEKREEAEENIFRLYEQTIGPFDPHMATKLTEAEAEYSWECIQHSFEEASENNARSWRYVEAILKAHKANGCYTQRRVEARASTEVLERHEQQQREKTA